MKLHFTVPVLLLCLALTCHAALQRGQSQADANVIQRFKVACEGDAILVPIQCKDKEYLFMVDTGASLSVYDIALKLGQSTQTVLLESAAGLTQQVDLYKAPSSKVGSLSAHPGGLPVIGVDLTKLRQVCGEPVWGILGMDFLGSNIVQIDFDIGELRILKAADSGCGKKLDVTVHDRHPLVKANVAEIGELEFVIDSGLVSSTSASIESKLFAEQIKKGHFVGVGSRLTETLTGTTQLSRAVGKSVSIGDFVLNSPIFGQAGKNLLGLAFLSRFVVTFDFAHNSIYLEKGKNFARPDQSDLSGLHVIRVEGKTLVYSVDEGSIGGFKGIMADDRILSIGGVAAEKMTLFQLRRALAQPGKTVQLTLRRGELKSDVELALK